jgi:gamma-glutamylcyclotransferase (GGCT)/AIG2-like uncharacterized protein YtfP
MLKLFVYGSLKLGECNQHVVAPWVENWLPAATTGEMRLRPDQYPALFLPNPGKLGTSDYEADIRLSEAPVLLDGDRVEGQLLFLREGVRCLGALDVFEGYFPGRRSEYLRVALSVETDHGFQPCWTYTGSGKPPDRWPVLRTWPPPGLVKSPEPYHHGL